MQSTVAGMLAELADMAPGGDSDEEEAPTEQKEFKPPSKEIISAEDLNNYQTNVSKIIMTSFQVMPFHQDLQ